jgi:aspartyl-tRNA(Asn)/glutamyl-tRNA(Gln) amidotransferase subunit B
LSQPDWFQTPVTPTHISDILELLEKETISSAGARDILIAVMKEENKNKSAKDLMLDMGLEQVSGSDDLSGWIEVVLSENSKSVEDYKNGKEKALQFLVGQVMRLSQGSANPPKVLEMLKKRLS